MRAKHPTKQRLNSFWFRMYCHGTPKDPDPSALRAAVASFPFQYKDEGVVQYRQIQEAVQEGPPFPQAHRGADPEGCSQLQAVSTQKTSTIQSVA